MLREVTDTDLLHLQHCFPKDDQFRLSGLELYYDGMADDRPFHEARETGFFHFWWD